MLIVSEQWWQLVDSERLVNCLCLLNQANRVTSQFPKCDQYFKSLKEICSNDAASFEPIVLEKFFLEHLSEKMQVAILEDASLKELALHKPQVIGYQLFLEHDGELSKIDGATKQKATQEHRQLSSAYKNFEAQSEYGETKMSLLKKLSRFLIRLELNKQLFDTIQQRGFNPDSAIYKSLNSFYDSFFRIIFDQPVNRLTSYGTLRPGESNYHQVETISGEWIAGTIKGSQFEKGGYPVFKWNEEGDTHSVQVLLSNELSNHWQRLDNFEGPNYERILIPVQTESHGCIISYVYNSA